LPYQTAWILDNSRYRLWDKSRRIGATYAESYRAVRDRNLNPNAPDYWFSSADESSAFEFAEYCRKWCDMFEAVHEQLTEIYDDIIDTPDGKKIVKRNNYVIRFPNGKRINCMTSNPRRFRSKGGDVVLDEFDWHDDPEEMYAAAESCLLWGGTLSILTTRSFEGSLFDRLVIEAKKVLSGELDPKKDIALPWSYHYVPITVAVEQGLAEKIYKLDRIDQEARAKFIHECRARARSQDKFNREYMCIPSTEATTLIPYDLYYSCQDENCLKTIGSGDKYLGLDVARKRHKTVPWLWELVGDVMVTRAVHRLQNTPYAAQQLFVEDLMNHHNVTRLCGDATGIGDMLIEYLQNKFGTNRVEKVTFTSSSKDKLASLMLARCQDKRVRLPNDEQSREAFHSIKKTVTAGGNVRYDTTQNEDEHADEFWAASLGLDAANAPADKPELICLN
jgi:phage FluMu gp28-like protein